MLLRGIKNEKIGNDCMVTMYGKPSDRSYTKARNWFIDNSIEFKERNIFNRPLSVDEFKGILYLTDNGTEDIIATRSKTFEKYNIDLELLTLKDLFCLIQENPGILKNPIIHDGKRLMVGFNKYQIRRFLPRSVRHNNFLKIID